MNITIYKIIAILLLLFNGVGAIYGGGNLILHPDGSSQGITIEWLRYSPFNDFLIPGIVLFLVNGILSFVVIIFILINFRHYRMLVIAEGVLLSGWIVIQMFLLRTVNNLHIIMGFDRIITYYYRQITSASKTK
jgi:hypothetical protein